MPTRLDAIGSFLREKAQFDLAALFSHEMEIQVNVGQDGGVQKDGEYQGHKYKYYEKDGERWKAIRIPYGSSIPGGANYEDKPLTFSTEHFEAIGMTGWNWVQQESHWVGFDFDSIANHTQGLSDDELQTIRSALANVPWVTSRRSTSGKGLHFYVFLEPPIQTDSHTEHAALARAILGILSARIGVRLDAKVDVYGGILWVWHRKSGTDGFTLIKEAEGPLANIPANWRDHADVVTKKRKKIRAPVAESADETAFEETCEKTKTANLDDGHRQLFGWLASNECLWWWDDDRHLLVAHTYDLAKAHSELNFKGPFYTVSIGKEKGSDQNCFAFPLRNGGWVVRRHTRKCPEHSAWSTDSSGWTRCYYNVPADLSTAARCHGGIERSDGRFEMPSLAHASKALDDLGAPALKYDQWIANRPALLKQHKDGRVILSIPRNTHDPQPIGWVENKSNWEQLVTVQSEQPETEVPDNFVRHLVVSGTDHGWMIFTRGTWIAESDANVRRAMVANGVSSKETTELQGQCVLNPWTVVVRPFQPEYPGNRTWNRNAPQFAYDPVEGDYPNWKRILDHCGKGLDDAVAKSEWCNEIGVTKGSDYLFMWLASMFQFPFEPLPYLFFYGPQNSGKSTFHEAAGLLFKNRIGYNRADNALRSTGNFNGELVNAVMCIVEETNLQNDKNSYSKIKDWVTGRFLPIHVKSRTPYDIPNTTHWVQCANEVDACPIFPGDTRITACYVPEFAEKPIDKKTFFSHLEVEAAAFLHALLNKEIPHSPDRLRVPVITSAEKLEAANANETALATYFREHVYPTMGHVISLQDLFNEFATWLRVEQRRFWTFHRFSRSLPDYIPIEKEGIMVKHYTPRGKFRGHYHLANVSLDPHAKPDIPFEKVYDRLVHPA